MSQSGQKLICLEYKYTVLLILSTNVTGPLKIGCVGKLHTISLNESYLSTGIQYLHSVTFVVKPDKCNINKV